MEKTSETSPSHDIHMTKIVFEGNFSMMKLNLKMVIELQGYGFELRVCRRMIGWVVVEHENLLLSRNLIWSVFLIQLWVSSEVGLGNFNCSGGKKHLDHRLWLQASIGLLRVLLLNIQHRGRHIPWAIVWGSAVLTGAAMNW